MTDANSTSKIHPSLSSFETLAAELKTHPDNARRGDTEAISESLKRFGQLRPIVALGDGTIVAGNHTFRAATEVLGWTTVAAMKVSLSPDEALAYLLADNRTAQLGSMDDAKLAELVERALNSPAGLAGTGYSDDDVNELAAQLAALDSDELEYQAPTNEFDDRHTSVETPAADLADRKPMEQFVLIYDADKAEELREAIKTLRVKWGVSGVREVVLQAVVQAAKE